MGAEQGTDYSCKLALGDMAVPGESAVLCLEMAAPRAESSRAQLLHAGHGCWTSALEEPVGKQLGWVSSSSEGLHGVRPSKIPP